MMLETGCNNSSSSRFMNIADREIKRKRELKEEQKKRL
jgi:hypothetical protein